MSPHFSVVIPTHNRLDVLPETLAALRQQERAPAHEVIVVDDGSTDGTGAWLQRYATRNDLRVIGQPNGGPARARNAGVRAALGQYVAFLGDDTIPDRGWLAAHARAHARRGAQEPLGVVGYTGWHPALRVTPFLAYINEQGPQFGYALIEDEDDLACNFFYTSNCSVSRALLLAEPFDESFGEAAWEDVEVGFRLKARGMRLIYAPEARVRHRHPTSLRRFAQRQERVGYWAARLYQQHPELGGLLELSPQGPPSLPSRLLYWIHKLRALALERVPAVLPRTWDIILRYHYVRGLHRGWEKFVLQDGDAV